MEFGAKVREAAKCSGGNRKDAFALFVAWCRADGVGSAEWVLELEFSKHWKAQGH